MFFTSLSKGLVLSLGLLLCLPFVLTAQDITGKVISSADKQPVQAASIQIKGTSKGTVTGNNGQFSLSAKTGDVLLLTASGFLETEITVNGSTTITIELDVNPKSLNEVVVTALGVKKETKRITYSIQDVKTADLIKAREPNPVSSLKGRVAGLNVNVNNELLRAPSINFRGEGNILFVVDGVPITTDTWNISPDDIESYTMLKGQTASALYGALARNGAIIINTKKGSKDKRGFSIEFNTSTMFEKGFLAFPLYQDEYGPGSRGKYAFVNGLGGGLNDNDYDVWGPRFQGQLIPQYDGQRTPGQTHTTTFADGTSITGNIKPTPWVARGKDNFKRFLETGLLSTNHVAIGATGDKYNVRFGVGHTYQKAIVPNMALNTTNFNLSAGYEFNSKIKLTADINYSRQYSPNFPDINYGPNSMIYNMVIWAGADWNVDDMRNYWQEGKIGTQQIYAEYQRYNNPWFMVKEWLRPHYKNDVYGYLSLNWKVAKGVEVMYRPGISTYNIFRQEKMPYSAGSYGRDERMGDYREDARMFFEANNELQVKYNSKFFNNFLSVDGFVGGNVRTARYNGTFASTDYLSVPGLYTLGNSLRAPKIASIAAEALTLSGYGTFDLGLSKYAVIGITGRVDKQSTLPLKNNTYFYPSVGVSTVVSDYIDNLPNAISFLKFRGSYAEGRSAGLNAFVGQPSVGIGTGQGYGQQYYSPINMGLYELTSIGYSIANSGTYGNVLGASFASGLLNPDLVADNRKTTEVGIDLRFFKNRIGLDVTYFHTINELLYDRNDNISQSSGYVSVKDNFGKIKNTGWEIMLNANPVSTKDFQWNVNVNWSTFTRIWKEHPSPNFWSKNGSRVDLIYQEGFIKTPDGQLVHGTDGIPMRFRDAGAGGAKRIMGHADPDWSWGVINSFTYKGFRLNFQFDGVVGGVFHNYVRQKTLQGGRHIETATGLWGQHRPNDVTGGSLVAPGITLTGGAVLLDPNTGEILNMKDLTVVPNTKVTTVQSYSSRYAGLEELNIIDKTFAKLREITLTYQLPASLIGKSIIKKAEVSLVSRNVHLFFNKRYKDVDPDQFTQDAGSGLQTPTTRRFGFNINLTF
jgi:TonB-linked SusC/RagA family outer membrane protein